MQATKARREGNSSAKYFNSAMRRSDSIEVSSGFPSRLCPFSRRKLLSIQTKVQTFLAHAVIGGDFVVLAALHRLDCLAKCLVLHHFFERRIACHIRQYQSGPGADWIFRFLENLLFPIEQDE